MYLFIIAKGDKYNIDWNHLIKEQAPPVGICRHSVQESSFQHKVNIIPGLLAPTQTLKYHLNKRNSRIELE